MDGISVSGELDAMLRGGGLAEKSVRHWIDFLQHCAYCFSLRQEGVPYADDLPPVAVLIHH